MTYPGTFVAFGLVCALSFLHCSAPTSATRGDTGPDVSLADVTNDVVESSDAIVPDAATSFDDVVSSDGSTVDATNSDALIADGGSERFRFGVFGDVRPGTENDTVNYPTMVIGSVMDGIQSAGAQFAVGTGDYMFASTSMSDVVNAQIDLLAAAEANFSGHIYHAMGNHECTGATVSNCPLGTETPNVRAFRTRLIADQPALYYDWTVHTSMGDAHFIVTAPNGWNQAQSDWLDTALAQDARYTFVFAHEPPTSNTIPIGTMPIDTALNARTNGVTMRLYGHIHFYRRTGTNVVVSGNSGAPLNGVGSTFGYLIVEQRADGNLDVTEYEIGQPPTVRDTFTLQPDGTAM